MTAEDYQREWADWKSRAEKAEALCRELVALLEWWQPNTEAADGRRRKALAKAKEAGL